MRTGRNYEPCLALRSERISHAKARKSLHHGHPAKLDASDQASVPPPLSGKSGHQRADTAESVENAPKRTSSRVRPSR
jgi:hypothetical protein